MALLFMEGFDYYASSSELTAKWFIDDTDPEFFIKLFPNSGRRGSACAGNGYAFSPINTAVGSAIVFGMAIKQLFGTSYNGTACSLFLSGQNHYNTGNTIWVGIGPSYDYGYYEVLIYGTAGGSFLSDPFPLAEDVAKEWINIEVKMLLSSSIPANSFVVKVNGVEVMNLPEGTDTLTELGDTAYPDENFIRFRLFSDNLYDDIYICDTSGTDNNDFLGNCRVDVIRPASDGAYHQGTPTSGTTHYSLVNAPQYNPAVGIVLNTTGYKESYGMTQLKPSGIVSNTVYGVELGTVGYNLDNSGSKGMGKLVVEGVSELELNTVTDRTLSSPSFSFDITSTDANAAQWTVSSVNNTQFGIVLKP